MATSATTTVPVSSDVLETLLFKATNPSNKLEDVNTIKQFCDAVNALPGMLVFQVKANFFMHF